VKAQTVVIDELRGLSTYTGNAEVTKGSLVLSAEEILIFSVKQTVSKIIAKGSKKKLAHYKQSQPNPLLMALFFL
jgi:lipopolysaccharide transport protein LptA